jgi:hypothetical protein
MSTLLHNVLASRLAAAAGGEGARVRSSDDEQALDEWEAVDSGASDDELVGESLARLLWPRTRQAEH